MTHEQMKRRVDPLPVSAGQTVLPTARMQCRWTGGRKLGFLVGLLVAWSSGAAELLGQLPEPLPLFPWDNFWNQEITWAPIDPSSDWYIQFINTPDTKRLHPDLGHEIWPGSDEAWGMPFVVVDSSQPRRQVNFYFATQSDGVGYPFYPIPDEAIWQAHWVQGGWPGRVDHREEDRHLLIVERDTNYLYELYNVYFDESTWQWYAGSGAFFDMNTNNRRPEGWTSANAAGTAILPGLIRYDEVYGADEIAHAFLMTVRTTNGYVYPASHMTSWSDGALPMGARLRLRADVDISGFPPECQKIFRAFKRFGLLVTDNGNDMEVGGTYDPRWNNDIFNPCFHALNAWHFEVIQLGWSP